MAKGNGHDKTTERMVEILERIEARLEKIDARLDQTNARLDHLIEISGATYRGHEARIAKLEAARTAA